MQALIIRVIDPNGNHIPFVVMRGEKQTMVADSLGVARLNISQNTSFENEVIIFSRLGYRATQRRIEELIADPIVIMQIAPIRADDYIVRAEPIVSPFRMTTSSRRIEIVELSRNYSSIGEIIIDIQNINVRGVRLAGERQTISIGGHHSRHTIIMLDNIVLNPTGQSVDLASIPFAEIESIEIVKNNVSVETGSGGIGGMIVLHTRKNNRQNQMHFSQSIGSFGSIKQNTGFRLWLDNFGISFNTSWLQADNDYEYEFRDETLKRQYNEKSNLNIATDLQYQIGKHDLTYNLRYQRFHNQMPGPINQLPLYLGAFQEGYTTHHNLLYITKVRFPMFRGAYHKISDEYIGKGMDIEIQAYQIDTQSIYNNTQAPIPFFHTIDENKQRLQGVKLGSRQAFWVKNFELSQNTGVEYKKEDFQINNFESYNQENTSFFISQAVSKDISVWTTELIGSYRLDYNDHFSTHNSWRFEFNNNFYYYIPFFINTSIGSSYMIPSFFELYWKGDSQTQGNPDLEPEKSIGYRIEGVLDSNPSLGIAYWHNRAENLIFWNRSTLGWKPFNLQTAEITNWELNGKYIVKGQSFSFNYMRTIAKDKSKNPDGSNTYLYDKFIPWTPSFYWDLQLNLKAGFFLQDIIYTAQGKQWSTRDQLIPPLKGHELWNTRTAFDFQLGIINTSLNLFVFNILDTKYENYPNQPEPGRHWEIQLSFRI